MIYKLLIIFSCIGLITAGLISAFKLNDWRVGIATILVGFANLLFMLR